MQIFLFFCDFDTLFSAKLTAWHNFCRKIIDDMLGLFIK